MELVKTIPGNLFNFESENEFKEKAYRFNKFQKKFDLSPENTKNAYLQSINCFSAFCNRKKCEALKNNKTYNQELIDKYVNDLIFNSNYSRATIELRLSVISVFLNVLEWPDPMKDKLFMDFIKKLKQKHLVGRQKQAEILSTEALEFINDKIIPESKIITRARLVVNMMFDGLLRASELINLDVEDVSFKEKTVYLKESKTDQDKYGSYRFISKVSLNLLSEYMREFNIDRGPIIRPFSPTLRIQERRVSYRTILDDFKRISEELGIENSLTTHSARVGGAVTLAKNNVDVMEIMRAGGWKSLAMVIRYTEQVNAGKLGMAKIANQINR